jgi:hypothetical protein
MNPYDRLLRNRSEISKNYAAQTLTIFRMFRKNQSRDIKRFLMDQIGDGRDLAKCANRNEYMRKLAPIVRRFQGKFLTNNGKRPNFGQAAKPVNLYIKHLLILPDCLFPLSKPDKRKLQGHAHVPLDRYVLNRMWGDRKKSGDFRKELTSAGIKRQPHLRKLEEEDYSRIQKVLAEAPRKKQIPAIAYDYLYALREK